MLLRLIKAALHRTQDSVIDLTILAHPYGGQAFGHDYLPFSVGPASYFCKLGIFAVASR